MPGRILDTLARMIRRESAGGDSSTAESMPGSVGKPEEGYTIRVQSKHFDEIRILLAGRISMENAEAVRRDLARTVEEQSMKNVDLDLSGVDYFDSSGVAILMEMQRTGDRLNNRLTITNVPSRIKNLLQSVQPGQYSPAGILEPPPEPNVVVQIGQGCQDLHRNTVDILTFIGASFEALWRDISKPGKVKWDRVWKLVERAGTDAVPIVTILSFLMGAILAFQSAIQLRKFGANIFVADLVSVSICLEMGPLLTALIVAGRSGAAYAAQIGTMQVNEEVDALRVMAIDPIRYLVSPRILAVAFALPCLTLIADLAGVVGGCLVATFSLDLTPVGYFNQVQRVLEVSDVLKGLSKSFLFGIEIAMIGCLRGFQVRGGAESVGTSTTSAVVTGIFVLTVTDAVFAVLFHYGPKV